MTETERDDAARREVEDLWWMRRCLESLIANKDTNSTIRVGLLRGILKTTRPETSTTDPSHTVPPAEGLPDCEGWTCQSCGADNFIPAGFARISPDNPGPSLCANGGDS